MIIFKLASGFAIDQPSFMQLPVERTRTGRGVSERRTGK